MRVHLRGIQVSGEASVRPLSSECGTYKTVTAGFRSHQSRGDVPGRDLIEGEARNLQSLGTLFCFRRLVR